MLNIFVSLLPNFMMSRANKLPSLDPEVAVELMNWTPPPPSTTIQQIRDGGEAYAATVLAWQREIAPPGIFPVSILYPGLGG